MKIITPHLVLRDFIASDIVQYQHLRTHPKFQRFYSEADAHPDRSRELLNLFIAQSRELPRLKYQLAVTLKSGELIGSCGIRIERPHEASMGCEIGLQWHGRGFGLEAGRAMLAFGFDQLELQRVYAETLADNLAAMRLCRMLGMTAESQRVDDKFFKGRAWTSVVMSIEREAFQQGKAIRNPTVAKGLA